MRVAVGMDHGGFPLKDVVPEEIRKQGYEPVDVGAFQFDPADDSPDFARAVGEAVDFIWAFLGATFSGEARHARRLGKVNAIEAGEAGGSRPHTRS